MGQADSLENLNKGSQRGNGRADLELDNCEDSGWGWAGPLSSSAVRQGFPAFPWTFPGLASLLTHLHTGGHREDRPLGGSVEQSRRSERSEGQGGVEKDRDRERQAGRQRIEIYFLQFWSLEFQNQGSSMIGF